MHCATSKSAAPPGDSCILGCLSASHLKLSVSRHRRRCMRYAHTTAGDLMSARIVCWSLNSTWNVQVCAYFAGAVRSYGKLSHLVMPDMQCTSTRVRASLAESAR